MKDDIINLENFDELWPELSFEQMVANSRNIRQTPYGLQDGNGVDVSLIRENLKLTPLERLRKGDRATRDCERIRTHARESSKPH